MKYIHSNYFFFKNTWFFFRLKNHFFFLSFFFFWCSFFFGGGVALFAPRFGRYVRRSEMEYFHYFIYLGAFILIFFCFWYNVSIDIFFGLLILSEELKWRISIILCTRMSQKFYSILVTNHTGLGYAKLAWYSPRATRRICFNGLVYVHGIHDFRPAWLCLVVEIQTTSGKRLQPSCYFTEINCIFKFRTNVFGCSRSGVMAEFELIMKISRIKQCCTFVWVAFKSYMKWNNP